MVLVEKAINAGGGLFRPLLLLALAAGSGRVRTSVKLPEVVLDDDTLRSASDAASDSEREMIMRVI